MSTLTDSAVVHHLIPLSWEAIWYDRAKRLTEHALCEWDADEPQVALSAALACLHIAEGMVAADELDGYPFPGEDEDEDECICPPDLVARGGFKGSCPAH